MDASSTLTVEERSSQEVFILFTCSSGIYYALLSLYSCTQLVHIYMNLVIICVYYLMPCNIINTIIKNDYATFVRYQIITARLIKY